MRLELTSKIGLHDGRVGGIAAQAERVVGHRPNRVEIVDVFLLSESFGLSDDTLRDIFCDTVAQDFWAGQSAVKTRGWQPSLGIEVAFKAGVTDPVAITVRDALVRERGTALPEGAAVQTAQQFLFWFDTVLEAKDQERLARSFSNPLIQRAEIRDGAALVAEGFPALYKGVIITPVHEVEYFDVAAMSDDQLVALSKQRLLALTLAEMAEIRAHYAAAATKAARTQAGLPVTASDVELEMLAQTWSEHCKHKIFAAHIDYQDDETGQRETIPGLFKTYIRRTTEDLSKNRPDLRSVFHDNAGVVDFDEDTVVCFKVETHNSPSALDPYGGAITGIVGVNRDILGTGKGAEPIFNTNFLCFADPATPANVVPDGLLPPRTVMEGVHKGIIDGGNQSGIPTAAGGFLFDESYLGKPLVFCGTGGLMPRAINGEPSWEKAVLPGHLAVMVGGRIGKDGIHGATFSSLALDEDSPSSAVQIGDPITQRKVWDFLIEARNEGLYEGITDNGAGGLSSSLGEMAQSSGGLKVELDKCPLKYPGLSPWEIWVSESQERMSLSVLPEKLDQFMNLAKRRVVEATVIGSFTDSGVIDLTYLGTTVGLLSMAFLHDGLPPMKLQARWPKQAARRSAGTDPDSLLATLGADAVRTIWLQILAHPNVRSKEALVRQYDHEVQGRTVGQAFRGLHGDAPTDGAVIRPVRSGWRALSVTHGVCPRVGDDDAYIMAVNAVDEAYRSHIALGGDPDGASALDNFCWPDPVTSPETPDGDYKLAQLVRANQGLREACLAYNLPLISGKDSMKNDARVGGRKISVRPTLLVSLMGIIPDSRFVPPSGFATAGQDLYLLAPGAGQADAWSTAIGGSTVEALAQGGAIQGLGPVNHFGAAPKLDLKVTASFYRGVALAIRQGLVAAIHDISDGGLAATLAESSFYKRLGAAINLPGSGARLLFGETPATYLVATSAGVGQQLGELVGTANFWRLGQTTATAELRVTGVFGGRSATITLPINEALKAWKKDW